MSLHTGDIDAAWDKLEMEISNTNHRHAKFRYGGKLILTSKRSFGRGPIEGPVQHLLRQQLKLNEDQFKALIDCPLKRPGYIEILKTKGLIPAEQESKQGKQDKPNKI